jgi:hypothetical protein
MARVGSLERYIAQAIRSVGTDFDRLVFFGSLRDAYTGHYVHEGWARVASPEEIHQVLRGVHQLSFESVLLLSLTDLGKQLRFHFRSANQPERDTSLLWLEAEPFRSLVPQDCSRVLRELFISQVKTALDVLCQTPDWSELAGPIALPHPLPDQSLLLHSAN